eukprot:COSAG02_NODE_68156_length_251_cov_0.684211_1_plen_32_part_01
MTRGALLQALAPPLDGHHRQLKKELVIRDAIR